jgi:hypothetical protein
LPGPTGQVGGHAGQSDSAIDLDAELDLLGRLPVAAEREAGELGFVGVGAVLGPELPFSAYRSTRSSSRQHEIARRDDPKAVALLVPAFVLHQRVVGVTIELGWVRKQRVERQVDLVVRTPPWRTKRRYDRATDLQLRTSRGNCALAVGVRESDSLTKRWRVVALLGRARRLVEPRAITGIRVSVTCVIVAPPIGLATCAPTRRGQPAAPAIRAGALGSGDVRDVPTYRSSSC